MTLSDVVHILKTARRIGADINALEDLQYIAISATVADEMAQTITDVCQTVAKQALIIQHTADTEIAAMMLRRTKLDDVVEDADN